MLPFNHLHQRNDENSLELWLYVCASLPSHAHHKLVIVERNGNQFACDRAVGGVLLALVSRLEKLKFLWDSRKHSRVHQTL